MKDFLSTAELKEEFDTFILVRRKVFSIIVYKRHPDRTRFEVVEQFPCAIGADGYETPSGPKIVTAKAQNPEWRIPNSPWAISAGLEPGKVVPGGVPENPIKAAFLKLTDDGVGIHGTDKMDSIHRRASHGCIRVAPDDAAWLYENVPVGTPVQVN